MNTVERGLTALLLCAIAASANAAATFELIVADPAGVGFNDPAPANAAAGLNGGATLGQQRLRVVQRAAEIWGEHLSSAVPIKIAVRMVEQPCGSDGTTLASAGPVDLAANFANAPRINTTYHIAQANALAGSDLVPERNDINANFNSRIDSGCSPNNVGWWYGIDAGAPVPGDRVAMLPVALHEFAHGLGFSAQVNLETGEYPGSHPTLWSNYLYDQSTLKHWRSMTSVERAVSARNEPNLVWVGRSVNTLTRQYLTGAPALMFEPPHGNGIEITELGLADFGAPYPDAPLTGQVVLANDGVIGTGDGAGTIHDGCETPFRNGQRLSGRIALIDRGFCTFAQKVRNAQQQGASAVIIVNNQAGSPPGMAGADPEITIPAIAVTRDVGARMKLALFRPRLVARLDQTQELAGVSQGCLRMHAPAELAPGSSVSHFTTTAFPDLLMEPSVTRTLFDDVDLTRSLFQDIGWPGLGGGIGTPPPTACSLHPLP